MGDERSAAARRVVFVAVALACAACSGAIEDPAGGGSPSGGGDPNANGTNTPGGADPGTGIVPGAAPGDPRIAQRVWRLTPEQINEELGLLFGDGVPAFDIPDSAAEAGFTNIAANAIVDLGNSTRFADGARAVGAWVASQGTSATRCASYGDQACVDTFLGWFLRGAFRRPVTDAETSAVAALFQDLWTQYDFDYAVTGVVRAVLLSPEFLYRTEIGEGGLMTPYEIASLLAFAVTDRSPDAMLFDAAERGELADAGVRETQARRLMAQSDRVWQRLFREWLGMETLQSQGVEVGLDPTLVAQMEEEFETFVSEVVVNGRGSLRDLLTAPYTWAQPELAAHYGASHPGAGLARIDLDPAQRGGLLTQGAWLVAHGKKGHDNVVRRGMSIFKQAMCNNDLKPPDNLDVNAALLDLVGPDATVREIVDARGAAPSCGTCHKRADPIGMVFENYTSDARWQSVYPDGLPIDTRVTLDGVGDFDRASALSAALVDEPTFQACFVRRVVHYLMGIDMGSPQGTAWVRAAQDAFVQHDTSLEELLVAIVRHPAFVERVAGTSP